MKTRVAVYAVLPEDREVGALHAFKAQVFVEGRLAGVWEAVPVFFSGNQAPQLRAFAETWWNAGLERAKRDGVKVDRWRRAIAASAPPGLHATRLLATAAGVVVPTTDSSLGLAIAADAELAEFVASCAEAELREQGVELLEVPTTRGTDPPPQAEPVGLRGAVETEAAAEVSPPAAALEPAADLPVDADLDFV